PDVIGRRGHSLWSWNQMSVLRLAGVSGGYCANASPPCEGGETWRAALSIRESALSLLLHPLVVAVVRHRDDWERRVCGLVVSNRKDNFRLTRRTPQATLDRSSTIERQSRRTTPWFRGVIARRSI